MKRREFLLIAGSAFGAGLISAGCTTTRPNPPADRVARRQEIDSAADGALQRLYANARGSREMADRAAGILIFPRVLSGGLGVGGEFGDGVLRTPIRPEGYYRLIGGSIGWQIGGQSQAVILMFMTQDALDRFRRSKGWTVGADASVAVAKVGATGEIDSNTVKQSIVGFALTNAGLYAGAKLEGAKVTQIDVV
jgi:lipid-binding SYLF domain-containing protein